MIALNRESQFDLILVGGGLQSGLIALAMRHYHPEARLLMIERGEKIAGNHTWSFHEGDVPDSCRAWVAPLIQHQWNGYDIRLGNWHHHLNLTYASISSNHFATVVGSMFSQPVDFRRAANRVHEKAIAGGSTSAIIPDTDPAAGNSHDSGIPQSQLTTDTEVIEIRDDSVTTRCGRTFVGDLVIDCRGPSRGRPVRGCGFQKFHGFEIVLDQDWPHPLPIVMQDVPDQEDGFRFLYSLPFDRRTVLVEDTRFSDSRFCSRDECLREVTKYVNDMGISQFRIVREESGVLPMPFSSELFPASRSPLAGGYAGGWFHAATGYSFPLAIAFAEGIAAGPLSSAEKRIDALLNRHRWRAFFGRFLNRLLFRLVAPQQRHKIFRRFYRVLDDPAVTRFYSHRFTAVDAFRIVVGVPPTLFGLRPLRFVRSFFPGAGQ